MSLSLDCYIETMTIIICIGVVLPRVGSLSLDCHHFDFLMSLKETNISVAIKSGSTAVKTHLIEVIELS